MRETVIDIQNRRSVKVFKQEQISDAELLEVLKAGMNAPSGGNNQTAVMIVVQNKELRDELSALNGKIAGAPEGFDVFYGAPTVIIVAAKKGKGDPVQDGCLVMGNLLNAAYAMGLGSRWINRVKEMFETDMGPKLIEMAGYEGEYIGIGACILGYPADGFPAPIEKKKDYYKIIR